MNKNKIALLALLSIGLNVQAGITEQVVKSGIGIAKILVGAKFGSAAMGVGLGSLFMVSAPIDFPKKSSWFGEDRFQNHDAYFRNVTRGLGVFGVGTSGGLGYLSYKLIKSGLNDLDFSEQRKEAALQS